ncbi:hypothetical protein JCM16358_15100 [Halanaerocella petrolearia]
MASLIGFIILFLGNLIILPLIIEYLKVNISKVVNGNLFLFCLISYLIHIPFWMATLAIYFLDFSIIDLAEENRSDSTVGAD